MKIKLLTPFETRDGRPVSGFGDAMWITEVDEADFEVERFTLKLPDIELPGQIELPHATMCKESSLAGWGAHLLSEAEEYHETGTSDD